MFISYHFEINLSLINHFYVGVNVSGEEAAQISTYFDIGSIIGGIVAGLAVDLMGASASVCTIMLLASLPLVRTEYKRVSLCGESIMYLIYKYIFNYYSLRSELF